MAAKTPAPPPPPPSYQDELFGYETKLNDLTKCTAAKRSGEDTATEGAKKSKKSYNFQRIWSEEDEIVVLKGLMDYRSKNNTKLEDCSIGFFEFIKNKLHMDVTRAQLTSKIRKMKIKYANNKNRKRKFSKSQSHDQKAYDLSEMIWGNGSGRGEKVANRKVKAVAEDVKKIAAVKGEEVKIAAVKGEEVKNAAAVVKSGEGQKRVMSMEERMLMAGREMYELGEEREEEWQKLRVVELELYQKEMEVKAAKVKVRIQQTKLVLDGIKGGGNLTSF